LLQLYLNKIKANNKEITLLKEKHASTTLVDQEKEISEELNVLIDENNNMCKTIKDELVKMEKELKITKEKEPDEPETRMKEMTFSAITTKFSDVLRESQNVQVDIKSSMKSKITRHVKLLDSTLTPDQIETICNDPEGAQTLLASKLMGPAHVKLQNKVSDIQDKYKDILKLEASVALVHKMFEDMALLVHYQGEQLDNIEIQMQQAHDYVQKGVKQLDKAQKSHRKVRKWQCILLIVLLVLILVIVLPIVL